MPQTITIDSSTPIAAAQQQAGAGGTILCKPGDYRQSMVQLVNGVTIKAIEPRKTRFISNDGLYSFVLLPNNAATFIDPASDGGFILPSGRCTLKVDGLDGTNFNRAGNTGFGSGLCIGNATGFQNFGPWNPMDSVVSNFRLFDGGGAGKNGGWGFGYYTGGVKGGAKSLKITRGRFDNVMNGCKANNVGATDYSSEISYCTFNKLRRDAAEYQGCGSGLIVRGNVVRNTLIDANPLNNRDLLNFSVIQHGINQGPDDAIIEENALYLTETHPNDLNGPRLAFELGNRVRVRRNLIVGNGHNTAFAWFFGDSNSANNAAVAAHPEWFYGWIENNRLINIAFGQGESGPYDSKMVRTNNGPDVVLDWDTSRPDPGPNWLTGGVIIIDPPPPTDEIASVDTVLHYKSGKSQTFTAKV